jgi:DNA-binding transcriptional regulator YiaG
MDQTTPYSRCAQAVFTIPFTIMVGIGTGGATTIERAEARLEKDAGFGHYRRFSNDGASTADLLSAAGDIAFIQSVFRVSATDLARCVGVTRQALYNWKHGAQIKTQHASKVQQLKAAATILAADGVDGTPLILRRTLPGGKTLLEAIASGDDGRLTARTLVDILRDEAAQTRMIEARLAGRRSVTRSDDVDAYSFEENG